MFLPRKNNYREWSLESAPFGPLRGSSSQPQAGQSQQSEATKDQDSCLAEDRGEKQRQHDQRARRGEQHKSCEERERDTLELAIRSRFLLF